MDRIDIQLWMHPVDTQALIAGKKAESSEAVAARVVRAREIQLKRFEGLGIYANAEMSGAQLRALLRETARTPVENSQVGLLNMEAALSQARSAGGRPRKPFRSPLL